MAKLTYEQKQRQKEEARKKEQRQIMLTVGSIAAVALVIVVIAIFVNVFAPAYKSTAVALAEDGSLHVPRSLLGEGFNYVNWGGTEELILYTNEEGEVLTAFDSCEECFAEGSVHFTLNSGHTICSVCNTVSEIDEFGAQEWGGCRPITVPASARQDAGSDIIISSECMAFAADMFNHWSQGDLSVTFASYEN